MKTNLVVLAAIGAVAAPTMATAAMYPTTVEPIALGSTVYTQNFDTLASSGSSGTALPAGWQVSEDGNNGNTAYGVGTGSSNVGNVYSFGSTGSSDRALGSLTSGTLGPAAYGVLFVNALGTTIDSLSVSYEGEQWRRGDASSDGLVFQYIINPTSTSIGGAGNWTTVDALGFDTPNRLRQNVALDGNLTANRTAVSATITGLTIAAGDTFAFRWRDLNVDGSDDGLAIDNVSVSAVVAAVPEPATWAMMLTGFGMVAGAGRYRRRKTIATLG